MPDDRIWFHRKIMVFRADVKDVPAEIEFREPRQEQLLEFIRLLSATTKEKLGTEEVFKAVDVVTKREQTLADIDVKILETATREKLRSRLALFLMTMFAFSLILLFLHSSGLLDLPADTRNVIHKGIYGALVGMF